jgi:branched-chain amino acid transport system permease protein
MLALGLNIVVGFAGLLDLGYIAFYAVGAYTFALLNSPHLSIFMPWWFILPLGAILAAFFGIMLGTPVLRLRGDYLAIVTLGFGEIIRIFMKT